MRLAKPQVSFPDLDKEILQNWEIQHTFERSNSNRKSGKEYSFYDGPPFANGLPHYGHLLANTIKDTVPRYWNMRGYHVERRFGWDCHGVPVEYEIEKTHQLKGRTDILKMGVAKFNDLCRHSVQHYTREWQRTITRLGRWVDWNHQYRTMDKNFMESVWWVLSELHSKGLLYKSHKVVSYSPRLTAVLSNFEANQNYKDIQDPSVTIKFKAADEDAYFLAWTTTPWTLISNLALIVGPDITYAKIKAEGSGEVYYLAESRLEANFPPGKEGQPTYQLIGKVKGSELKGREYLPLFPYFKDQANAFQVLLGEFVDTNDGTGIVHGAPAFGEDDYRICSAHGIALVDPLDSEANFTAQIPELEGQFFKDADKEIIRRLKAEGKLLKHTTIVHSYPHCERTEGPLIYRAVPAWYVAVEKFKANIIANNKTINWVPGHLRDGRMGMWLENARDWAISRNRFWGTPLPIWECENKSEHITVIGSVAELEKKAGVNVSDLHKEFVDHLTFPCASCGKTMRRVPEVFDCWFESGAMPYCQHHYPFENKSEFGRHFPADFIAEGQDQTRGWFYTLSVLSAALFAKPAFKNVIVNGMVLAENGRKMSKRLKNYTPPEELLEKHGADSVRLYLLNSPVLRAEDLRFSDAGVRDLTRAVLLPYWNAYSFLSTYAAADNWKPSKELASGLAPTSKNELDQWIISRLQTLVMRVHEQMEKYLLYNVIPVVLTFIEELTNWYIRLSRRRFWGESSGDAKQTSLSNDSRSAYETLFYVLTEFSKVFAPFAPFVSEAVYQSLTEGIEGVPDSVHLCNMPTPNAALVSDSLEYRMQLANRAVELGRSLRAKHQIKTRQVLSKMLVITRKDSDRQHIIACQQLLIDELNVKKVEFSTEEGKYLRHSIMPNLKTLGPKLGSKLGEIRKEFSKLNALPGMVASILEELGRSGSVKVFQEGLKEEDFLIDLSAIDQQPLASDKGVTVILDTLLTPELVEEGIARELVNRIQNLRKDSGLQVSDRIRLHIDGDAQIVSAIKKHQNYVCGETLSIELNLAGSKGQTKPGQYSGQYDINGMSCQIGITIAKK